MLEKVYNFLEKYMRERFTGSITIHWNKGRPYRWEVTKHGTFYNETHVPKKQWPIIVSAAAVEKEV